MQEKRKMVRQLVVYAVVLWVFASFVGSLLGEVMSIRMDKASTTEIMSDKERAYQIYNEGLEASEPWYDGYDSVAISSPSVEDRKLAYHQGVKYVRHPDLLELEVIDDWCAIKYDGTFKFYGNNNENHYIEILVDREHIDAINYYDYREVVDKIGVVKTAISGTKKVAFWLMIAGIIVIIIANIVISISGAIENWHQKNKQNPQSRQEDNNTKQQKDNYKEEKETGDEEDDEGNDNDDEDNDDDGNEESQDDEEDD